MQQLNLKTSVSKNLVQPSVKREDLIKGKHCAFSIPQLVTEPQVVLARTLHQRKDLCEFFFQQKREYVFPFLRSLTQKRTAWKTQLEIQLLVMFFTFQKCIGLHTSNEK